MAKEVKAGVKITGKDASKSAFDSLSKSLSKTDRKLKGLANKMAPLAKGFGIVGGAAAAAGGVMIAATVGIASAIYKTVDATATYLDELMKFSRQTGFAVEALQQLDFVAKRNGLSFEKNRSSIVKFSKVFGELKTGSTVTQLEKVDKVLAKQIKAAPNAATAYFTLMDSLARMEDPTKKSAIAFAVFGRTGQEVLRLVDGGPEAFAALRKEAEKYGIVLGADAAKAEAFKDAQENMQQAVFGLKTALSIGLMPALADGATKIADFIAANRPQILAATSVLMSNISDTIGSIVNYLTSNPDALMNFVQKAANVAADLVKSLRELQDVLSFFGIGEDRYEKALKRTGTTEDVRDIAPVPVGTTAATRVQSGFAEAARSPAATSQFGGLGLIASLLKHQSAPTTSKVQVELTVKPAHGLDAGVAINAATGTGVSIVPPKVDENYFGGGF